MAEQTRRPVKKSTAAHRSSQSAQAHRNTHSSSRYEEERPVKSRSTSSHGTSSHSTSSGHRRPATSGKRPAPVRKQKKKKGGKIILFVVEIIILLIMLVVLYGVLKTEKVGKVEIPEEDIVINEEVKEIQETSMKGYRNIALFGVDSRDKELDKKTRSDTIMIASINQDTGDVKLVSVYRDTYLNLSNDTYNKCNAAYAKGGPEQAINMLNMNLDMNITDFVTVGFEGLTDTIDALGGIPIDVQESEISHLNNYQISMVGTTKDGEHFEANAGTDYTPVTSAGLQTLNGLQATAYCRIRYVGNDFERAARQRRVLMAVADKAKSASPATLNAIANDVFKEVYTSLDLSEIIEVLGNLAKYNVVDQGGFPEETMRGTGTIGSKGSCVVPMDLTENVTWLHRFLFDDQEYTPSSAVQSYSEKIKADTSAYARKQ